MGAVFVARCGWVTDDAYITFRHVANFNLGHGPVFNVGERVQAFTHPLWFLMLLAGSQFADVYAVAVGSGLLLTVATVVSLAWFLRGANDRTVWLVAAFTALFGSRTFVEFQTSGLETSLSTLLLVTLTGWVAARDVAGKPPPYVGAAWLCGLLLLNRLDHAMVCGPIVVALLVCWWRFDRRWRTLLGMVSACLPLLVWHGFATIYYGSPLPNTAYAKIGLPLAVALRRGADCVRVYVLQEPVHAVLIVAALGVGLAKMRRRAMTAALTAGIVLQVVYVTVVGGDFMRGRFFLPTLVVAVVLLTHAGAAAIVLRRCRVSAVAAAGFAAVGAAYLAGNWIHVFTAIANGAARAVGSDALSRLAIDLGPWLAVVFTIGLIVLAWLARRRPGWRLAVTLAWVLATAVFLGGAMAYYPWSRGLGLLMVGAIVGVLAVLLRSWRVGASLGLAAAVAAAAIGSMGDLTPREPLYGLTGVSDEWVWYVGKPGAALFAEPAEWAHGYPHEMRDLGDSLHAYARQYGPIALAYGSIGILSYHAGPDVHIIDIHQLADAFLARERPVPVGRIGHPQVHIPGGYLESRGAINLLLDWRKRLDVLDPTLIDDAHRMQADATWASAAARARHDRVRTVVSGPIFSRERLALLFEFTLPARAPAVSPCSAPVGPPASPYFELY